MAYEGYTLSNPLSGGELVLVAITGGLGFMLSDFVGRYMSTTAVPTGSPANSLPAAGGSQVVPNDLATTAFPPWQAMAAQFGIAAAPLIGAAFVDSPWGRAALQGAGLGAGFALLGSLGKSLMAKLIGGTTLGQQLYLAEVEAQAAVTAATPASGSTTTPPTVTSGTPGVAGLPRGVGRRPAMRDPGPQARGMGQVTASAFVPTPQLQTLAPNAYTPPYSPGGPGNPPPPVPGGSTPPAIYTPGGPPTIPVGHPAHPLHHPAGIHTNTSDVIQTPAPGTVLPGGPNTGPMCAPCTSTSGGIAATHAAAQAAIRDESCLGKLPAGFGQYSSFPDAAE